MRFFVPKRNMSENIQIMVIVIQVRQWLAGWAIMCLKNHRGAFGIWMAGIRKRYGRGMIIDREDSIQGV